MGFRSMLKKIGGGDSPVSDGACLVVAKSRLWWCLFKGNVFQKIRCVYSFDTFGVGDSRLIRKQKC